MIRRSLGVAALLCCVHTYSLVDAANPGPENDAPLVEMPAQVEKPTATPSSAKAGIVGGRRYQLLFGPDLDVIGALKIAPEISVEAGLVAGASLPWIPTGTVVTLGANLQYIEASEVQTIEFLVDGAPISALPTGPALQKTYEFPANPSTTPVNRTLAVRVTDTDGVVTQSAAIPIILVTSQVIGQFYLSGTDPNRKIEGWACATGYAQSLQVRVMFGASLYLQQATNLAVRDPAIAAQCLSAGAPFKFSIPINSGMYEYFSGQTLTMQALSVATPISWVLLAPNPSTPSVINELPSIASALDEPLYMNGKYIVGENPTHHVSAQDQDGTISSLIVKEEGGPLPCALANGQCQWHSSLSSGSRQIVVEAVDNRGAKQTHSFPIQTVHGTPFLDSGQLTNPATYAVQLQARNLTHQVRVSLHRGDSGAHVADYELSSVGESLSFTLQTAHRTVLDGPGLFFTISNLTPGHPIHAEWETLSDWVFLQNTQLMLVRPSAGEVFAVDQSILLEAEVGPGAVTKVEFLRNGTIVGEAIAPPYVAVWNSPMAGIHSLRARVTYASGQQADSTATSINVVDGFVPEFCPIPSAKSGLVAQMPANHDEGAWARKLRALLQVVLPASDSEARQEGVSR